MNRDSDQRLPPPLPSLANLSFERTGRDGHRFATITEAPPQVKREKEEVEKEDAPTVSSWMLGNGRYAETRMVGYDEKNSFLPPARSAFLVKFAVAALRRWSVESIARLSTVRTNVRRIREAVRPWPTARAGRSDRGEL